MNFAQPLLLALLPLSLLPLLLHLLGRRERKILPFPWVRFLIEADTEGRRFKQLFELIILLLRILALAAVILAFSSPFLSKANVRYGRLALDLSHSMAPYQTRIEGFRRLLVRRMPDIRVSYFANQLLERVEPTVTLRSTSYEVLALLDEVDSGTLVLTDLQRSGLGGGERLEGEFTFVKPTRSPYGNSAILSLRSEQPYLLEGIETVLTVKLMNYDTTAVRRRVKFYLGDEVRDFREVSLPAGEETILEFRALPAGETYIKVTLDPPDAMPGDDERFRVLPALSDVKVLLLGTEEECAYVRAALEPEGTESPFAVTIRENLGSYGILYDFDIAGVIKRVQGAERMYLKRFSESGGRLVLFTLDPDGLLADLKIGAERAQKGRLTRSRFLMADEEVKEGFPEFLSLDPDAGVAVAWTASGQALGLSVGSILVLGFEPRPLRTDFVFSSLFVPFLHRAFADLVIERGRTLNLYVGEPEDIPVEDIGTYTLRKEGGVSQALKASLRGRRPVLTLSGIEEPGIYVLTKGQDLVARIAANLDPRESDPTPLSDRERAQYLGDGRFFASADEFFDVLGPQVSLRIPLFWAALAFLLLEMILLRWRSLRRKRLARETGFGA